MFFLVLIFYEYISIKKNLYIEFTILLSQIKL